MKRTKFLNFEFACGVGSSLMTHGELPKEVWLTDFEYCGFGVRVKGHIFIDCSFRGCGYGGNFWGENEFYTIEMEKLNAGLAAYRFIKPL